MRSRDIRPAACLPSAASPDPSRRRLVGLLLPMAMATMVTTGSLRESAWAAERVVSGLARGGRLRQRRYAFFSEDDATFLDAAVERLIPADQHGPGARQAGVTAFIDRCCLQGTWRLGERLYRSRFWHRGAVVDGYVVPASPGSLFRAALRGIEFDLAPRLARWPAAARRHGSARHRFAYLPSAAQDAYLRGLQTASRPLEGVPSRIFLHLLFALTVEAFFADPVFSGNEDTVA